MGYHRAGFTEIVGVDNRPQKHYPFKFVLGDALDFLRQLIATGEIELFDGIHASPPCKGFTNLRFVTKLSYENLNVPTRDLLLATGKPFVLENVEGAPLINPLMLCGTMFGLRVIRHRLFETTPPIYFPPHPCNHWGTVSGNSRWRDRKRVAGALKNFDFLTITGNDYIGDDGRKAMEIDWMTKAELSQAIPPAYTEYIGKFLMETCSLWK